MGVTLLGTISKGSQDTLFVSPFIVISMHFKSILLVLVVYLTILYILNDNWLIEKEHVFP